MITKQYNYYRSINYKIVRFTRFFLTPHRIFQALSKRYITTLVARFQNVIVGKEPTRNFIIYSSKKTDLQFLDIYNIYFYNNNVFTLILAKVVPTFCFVDGVENPVKVA